MLIAPSVQPGTGNILGRPAAVIRIEGVVRPPQHSTPDIVELTDANRSIDTRRARIERIRASIAAGLYPTDAQLDVAAERVLEDLRKV